MVTEYVPIAKIKDVPPGSRLIFRLPGDGPQLALFNVEGTLYCIADVCTHDDGPVAEGELRDYTIECPRHGACFDIRDGRVLSFPAITPIDTYAVKVEGDDVWVSAEPR
jgi:3-phenylpropionate/trans-cinnamate dioxygenase ferredoxin subunit